MSTYIQVSHIWISLGNLQGHDGENLHVGRWVAVAYDDGFYVGKIMSLKGEEEIRVDFLTQKKDGSFKLPRPNDCDKVSAKYIFCSTPRVQ